MLIILSRIHCNAFIRTVSGLTSIFSNSIHSKGILFNRRFDMGCDIYMHSQVKIDGKWQWHDQEIYNGRSYTLFGILDGTRSNEFEPIAENKGFPDDSEDKLKPANGYDPDYVTESGVYLGYAGVSYLSLIELRTFDWSKAFEEDSRWRKEVLPYLEACAEKYGGPENVRIVFGYSV